MPLRTPRLLIASSSEGLPYAETLQALLSPEVEASVWNQGMFVPGEYVLESLEALAQKYDGAVVVATADDTVVSRGVEHSAPRDNLLLEYGIFVATFGRRRALLMVERVPDGKLPSDVAGLTVLQFHKTEPRQNGIGPSATRLRELANTWRDRPYESEVLVRFDRVLRLLLSDLQDRSGIAAELGIHVFLVEKRTSPPELFRVARARSNPKAALTWGTFGIGVGIVGTCWRTGSAVFCDLTADMFQAATAEDWNARGPDERFGMDFEMLKVSRERYKCVGAVPITTISGGGEFLGCISYNLGVASSGSPAQLSIPAVGRALDAGAEMVAIVI